MSEVAARDAVQRLAEALLADVERIAARSVARMQELLPSYAQVPAEALIPVTATNTRNLLVAVSDLGADYTRADDHFRLSGETRLSQGITADEMLQAWRIGLEVVREEAHIIAKRLDLTDGVPCGSSRTGAPRSWLRWAELRTGYRRARTSRSRREACLTGCLARAARL
ncbi:MAG TPA: hypothetical protein VMA96_16300 [Solirubrobacteraceae bacterium]|nr:hypothetical protein [Solirubrobacteraceae bacterium]